MKKEWKKLKLDDMCSFINGLWKGKKPQFIEVGVIRNTNFTKEGNLDFSNVAYLDVEESQFKKRKLEYGDIILEKSGGGPKQPVGRVALFEKNEGLFSLSNFTTLIRIKNKDEIDSRYLHWYLFYLYLMGITEKLQKHSTGIRNLKLNEYKQITVPVPPISEQYRMVNVIEKAIKVIQKAQGIAEKNIQNAKELFYSYLNSLFSTDEVDGIIDFSEIIEVLTDYHANGSYKVLKENVSLKTEEDYAWMVRSTDFENNFQNDFRYIDKDSYDFMKKSPLFGGEIIMSKIGNAGRVYLMPKVDRPCSLAMNLFLIRINNNRADSRYIYYYLKSEQGSTQIASKLNGAATLTITKKSVRSLRIPLFTLDKQQQIIKKLDELLEETEKLETMYEQKLTNLEELKKSILQKAFNGEL